ncbi:MerR family transcriptional regulator [Chloroflexia bacterium SDU3-3]|nr:MerR family transcriptional regulator [Chloroflexia bacterium SDU3-3]
MDPHDESAADEWLTLQEASERLGVASSTLRRWGDEGLVPIKRTLGGHRRFSGQAIARLATLPPQVLSNVAPPDPAPAMPWGVDERALAQQDWHARMASHGGPERMRGLGQRLLGLLAQYAARRGDEERFLAEAREVGIAYGTEARASGVSLYETVEAFLFFRTSFAGIGMPIIGVSQPLGPEEAAALHVRVDRFMDTVLLGVIEGYEQPHG